MQIGKAAALVAGIGLLASCLKTFNPTEQPVPCASTSCQVSVAITAQTSPFKCNVDVQPQVLDVSGGLSPKTITWTFTVTVDGVLLPLPPSLPQLPIKFDSNADDVIKGLTLSGSTLSGTYYRPSTGDHHHYGYGILVPVAAGLCNLDPWVVD